MTKITLRKDTAPDSECASTTPPRFLLGISLAGFAAVMSLLLAWEHVGGLALPGCGAGGPCEQAANSFWGSVRLGEFHWPVAFLGLSWFVALTLAWIITGGVLPALFRYLVRLGALISAFFCVIIIIEQTLCPYCIAAHVANFLFWLLMETIRVRQRRFLPALVSFSSAWILATVAAGVWQAQVQAAVNRKGEAERTEAVAKMIERSHQAPVPGEGSHVVTAADDEPEPGASGDREPAQSAPAVPFEGRYRWGPAEAPIRIVLFTSFQCRDCRRIESQVTQLRQRDDVAISMKHFPLNTDCNPQVQRTSQPNACWAARASEAAGILWGTEGFWKMHDWLFEHQGVFTTTEELLDAIRSLGYEPGDFVKVMTSQETLDRVLADADEGEEVGLHFTPMVFINGVELKGWYSPNALVRTVEQVAATNPPARIAAYDHPPKAVEKYVADWREEPVLDDLAVGAGLSRGPADAPVQVVMWGDYQEQGSCAADAGIRAFMESTGQVHYTYRHYPFNSKCNQNISAERHPLACRAAFAAEAAGALGGPEAHWQMHVWLMEHREEFNDETLRAEATALGLDPDALLATLDQPASAEQVTADTQAGKKLPRLRIGVRPGIWSIPTIFVNGKYIPRWRLEGEDVLTLILREAAEK